MSKTELLVLYKKNVEEIRNYARNCNFSDSEINKMFEECLIKLREEKKANKRVETYYKFHSLILLFLKIITIFTSICIISYVILNVHQTTSSIVLRNVQGFIYPGLKLLRFLSVPFVRRFPSLTELYDESCLVQNPYFYVSDMECWPCENAHSVIDITDLKNKSIIETGIPYLVRTNQKTVTFNDLRSMYNENKETFDENASTVKANNYSLKTTNDLFTPPFESTIYSNTHIIWRINRMTPARLIRKLFPRPDIINKWSGQSMERFVFIDGSGATSYVLPSPECSYVFLIQGSGERTIILKPSKECSNSCKTVSVVLKPAYVLWYNWWYWRPLSLPVKNSTEASLMYMNSYC